MALDIGRYVSPEGLLRRRRAVPTIKGAATKSNGIGDDGRREGQRFSGGDRREIDGSLMLRESEQRRMTGGRREREWASHGRVTSECCRIELFHRIGRSAGDKTDFGQNARPVGSSFAVTRWVVVAVFVSAVRCKGGRMPPDRPARMRALQTEYRLQSGRTGLAFSWRWRKQTTYESETAHGSTIP